MATTWTYPHQDLEESSYPDGSPIRRPVVPLEVAAKAPSLLGVLDSGSPISVANAALFSRLGVDLDTDAPLYEVPLGVGGRFSSVPVYEVEIGLRPPTIGAAPVRWRLPLGARGPWHLPFAVLLGQRGWFDRFPTRIDANTSTVEV